MNKSLLTRRNSILASSIAALLGATFAQAADLTWNSAGLTDNWSTAAGNENWLPGGVLWTNNDSAIFDLTSGLAETVNVTTANIFDNITFDVTGFTIGNGAGSLSLSNDLASTITVTNGTDTATISETLGNNAGGASALTKAGAGTLVLNSTAASTYSGGTTISAGTLTISQAGALGTGGVTNNATLNISIGNATATGLSTSMSGAGTTNVTLPTGSNTTVLNGNYSGYTGTWNVGVGAAAGAGKIQLNGLDNASSTINVLTNGTVFVSAAVTKNAAIVLNGGDTGEALGQLRLEGGATWAGSVTLAGTMVGTDGFVGANSGTGTISGVIGESGGARVLSKSGAGTTVLSGLNTYSGGTAVLNGTLSVSVLNNTGASGNVGTGSTVNLGAGTTGATLLYTGAGETTDRVINLAGTTGGGVINQSGASGNLRITGNLMATGAGAKTLTLTGSTAATGEISGSIVDNSGTNLTSVTKTGTGIWTLSGASSYSGLTTVGDGVLRITHGSALGAAGTAVLNSAARTQINAGNGRLELSGGITVGEFIHIPMRQGAVMNTPALSNFSGNNTITAVVGGLTGGARVNIESQAGLLTLAGGITQIDGTSARTFQLMGAGDGLISGPMTNGTATAPGLGIIKSGTGTWTLAGLNTNGGSTQLDAGTLRLDYSVNNTTKLADGAALFLNGGTLEMSGGTHSEVVGSTTALGGNTTVTRTGGATGVLNLNTVTALGGSVTFTADNIATTDNLNSNGILPWARFAGNNWGTNSTNGADGLIVAYTGAYADVTRLGTSSIPDGFANNVRIINGGTAGNITLTAAPQTSVNSLLVDASDGASTIAPGSPTDIFMVGDEAGGTIWQTATSGGLTIGAAANDGILTTGNTANALATGLTFINDSTANALTVNSAITNNGTDIVTVNKGGAGTLVLAGNNSFTGAVNVNQGTLQMTGNNSFTGALTIANGTTAILSGNNSARPSGASNLTVLQPGGTLQLQANAGNTSAGVSSALSSEQTANQPFLFNNMSTLQLRGDSSVAFSGGNNVGGLNNTVQTIDVNQLTAAGVNQTLTFAPGTFNYGNAVTINATGGNGYSLGLGTAQNVVNATGTLTLNPTTASVNLGGFHGFHTAANTAAASLVLSGSATGNVVSGVIANQGAGSLGTGATSVTKNGTSTWTLNGVNTYTGATTISSGTLAIGGSGSLGGGTYAGAITNNGALVYGSSATQTLSGVISGTGTLTANGNGILTLSGTNTYTGATTITSGTVIAQNNAAFGNAATAGVTVSGTGTIDLSGTLAANALNLGAKVLTVSGSGAGGAGVLVNNGANDQINATGRIVLAGNATFGGTKRWDLRSSTPTLDMGGFNLTKVGPNRVSLVGVTVSNPGNITINGGILGVETTTNLGGSAANAINVGEFATLGLYANTVPLAWTVNLTDATLAQDNTNATVSGPATLTGANTITGAGTSLTMTGNISGTGGFTKTGVVALTLSGNNSYDGPTAINVGRVTISHANALGSGTGGTSVANNAILQLTGGITTNSAETASLIGAGSDFNGALQAGTGGGTWAGGITLGDASLATVRIGASTGNTLTITGTIADGASTNINISGQSGTGVVVLNPTTSNSYTGITGLVRGILRIGKNDAMPTGTTLDVDSADSVADAATFDLAGFNQTVGALQDSATLNVNGLITNSVAATTSVLTVDGSLNTTFNSVIENGVGTVALTKSGTGALTLAGANTFTGATAVSGGTLLVSGSISGSAVTVSGTGTLGGAGGTVGALTALSGGTIAPGASPGILNSGALSMTTGSTLSIEVNGTTLGTGYDQLSVTGGVDITGATLTLGGTFNAGATNDLFTILLNDGAEGVVGTFNNLPQGAIATSSSGQLFEINYVGGDGNDIVLTAVPEPGSAALLLGGLALLGARRRRKA